MCIYFFSGEDNRDYSVVLKERTDKRTPLYTANGIVEAEDQSNAVVSSCAWTMISRTKANGAPGWTRYSPKGDYIFPTR